MSQKRKRNTNEETELIEKELQSLKDKGLLFAGDVVAAAEDPDSVLHDEFTWDDTVAAHQYRLNQARVLIAHVVLVDEGSGEKFFRYSSLRIDQVEPNGGYRETVDVLNDAELRALLLEQAYDDFKSWERKYGRLVELAEIFSSAKNVFGRGKKKTTKKTTRKPKPRKDIRLEKRRRRIIKKDTKDTKSKKRSSKGPR